VAWDSQWIGQSQTDRCWTRTNPRPPSGVRQLGVSIKCQLLRDQSLASKSLRHSHSHSHSYSPVARHGPVRRLSRHLYQCRLSTRAGARQTNGVAVFCWSSPITSHPPSMQYQHAATFQMLVVALLHSWLNSLSEAVVSSLSLQTFRRHLKTHLFRLFYSHLIFWLLDWHPYSGPSSNVSLFRPL